MEIPATLRAGDTWSWTDSLGDYPATTWTLKYALRGYGLSTLDITATASGSDHAAAVAAVDTSSLTKGDYKWTAYVERTVAGVVERHTVGEGVVTVKPNLIASTSTSDNRDHAEKALSAIEAVILGRASHAELSLTVNGKAVQYLKPAELIQWRSFYIAEVARLRDAENIAAGLSTSKRILTRFTS